MMKKRKRWPKAEKPRIAFSGSLLHLVRAALDTGQVVGHAERHLLERFAAISANFPQPIEITAPLMAAAAMQACADFHLVYPAGRNPFVVSEMG